MCEEVFGHGEKLLELSFQTELLLQGKACLEHPNSHPWKKIRSDSSPLNVLDEICIFGVSWKLNDWWRHRFAKSATWLNQICVLWIIQLFPCMHIFLVFSKFAFFVSFCMCTRPFNPVIYWIWSLNLLMIFLPLLINTMIFTFPKFPSSSLTTSW